MYHLACPKCHQPLFQKERSYLCEKGHCYDISKRQYINLLLNPDKASAHPGDNKESLLCRQQFLNRHYYDCILNEVIACIRRYPHQQILDLGCGEGYYTAHFHQAFLESDIYGLDISKEGISMATRYTKDVCWIVGNSKNIPLLDHSLDIITALFTVVNADEIRRCLKKGGHMIHVTANPHHLIEWKKLIYDEIIVKSDEHIRLPFQVAESYDFTQSIHFVNLEDALHLFKMTPHYYHIKKEKRDVLKKLNEWDVTIDIRITVYEISDS